MVGGGVHDHVDHALGLREQAHRHQRFGATRVEIEARPDPTGADTDEATSTEINRVFRAVGMPKLQLSPILPGTLSQLYFA